VRSDERTCGLFSVHEIVRVCRDSGIS